MRWMRRKVGLLLHYAVKHGHFKHHKGNAVSEGVGRGRTRVGIIGVSPEKNTFVVWRNEECGGGRGGVAGEERKEAVRGSKGERSRLNSGNRGREGEQQTEAEWKTGRTNATTATTRRGK